MRKTEVYSWRLAFDLKRSLEEAANSDQISLVQLLERIVLDWLAQKSRSDGEEEETQQQRLHQSAAQAFGTIHSGVAERESLSTIFTIDHNDFETYRIEGKRKFSVFPSR